MARRVAPPADPVGAMWADVRQTACAMDAGRAARTVQGIDSAKMFEEEPK